MDDSAVAKGGHLDAGYEPYPVLLGAPRGKLVPSSGVVIGQRCNLNACAGNPIDQRGRIEPAVTVMAMQVEICDQVRRRRTVDQDRSLHLLLSVRIHRSGAA